MLLMLGHRAAYSRIAARHSPFHQKGPWSTDALNAYSCTQHIAQAGLRQ